MESKRLRVVPYDPLTKRACYYRDPLGYVCEIKDVPLYFGAAQTLINGSKQYYPFSMPEEVREEPMISLYYYNPLVLKVLKTILEDPNCKWHVEDDKTVVCFYPVDKPDPSLLSDTVTLREDTGEKENVLIILEEKANEEWARMQAALILS